MFFWPLNPTWTQIRTLRPRLPEVRPSFNYHCLLLGTSKNDVFLTFQLDLYSNSDSLTSITQGSTKFYPSSVSITSFFNRCLFDLWTQEWLIFGLPDLDYPGSDQVSTIVGHYYEFLKPMFFWPQMETNTQPIFFHMTLLTIEGIWSKVSNRNTNSLRFSADDYLMMYYPQLLYYWSFSIQNCKTHKCTYTLSSKSTEPILCNIFFRKIRILLHLQIYAIQLSS